MIESDCAGCTNSQDALHFARDYQAQQYFSTTTTANHHKTHQTANNHQNQRDSLPTFTSPPPIVTSNPTATSAANLQSGLNYFQHAHLQPLLGHHLLLASSAPGSTGPFSSANARFALTPDARACVTATYLCVLIVNNTWLDCNLLETLCNNNNNNNTSNQNATNETNNSNSNSSNLSADKAKQEEYQLAAAAEATMKLNALESSLSELISFAGGGDQSGSTSSEYSSASTTASGDTTYSDNAALDRVYRPPLTTVYFRQPPEEPGASSQRFLDAYVDKGGGGGGGGGGNEDTDYEAEFEIDRPFSKAQLAHLRSSRPTDGDGYKQMHEQMLDIKSGPDDGSEDISPADGKLAEHYLSHIPQHIAKQRQQVELESEKSVHNDTRGEQMAASQPSSLASWVGRPFRGWGSYSFWPNGNGGTGGPSANYPSSRPDESQQQAQQKQQQRQQVQILRPVDRIELYNDIVTNQSSFKQQSIIGHQQQFGSHQHRSSSQQLNHHQAVSAQQQPDKTGIPQATTEQAANIPMVAYDASIMMSNVNSVSNVPSQLTSTTIINADNNNSNDQPIFAFSPTPPITVQGQSIGEHLAASHSVAAPADNDNNQAASKQNLPQYPPSVLARSPATPAAASSLLGIYDFTNANTMGSFAPNAMMASIGAAIQHQQSADRNQQLNQNPYHPQHHHHHHLSVHQHPLQQFAQQDDAIIDQCKCNELDELQLSQIIPATYEECRFKCASSSGSSAPTTLPTQSVSNGGGGVTQQLATSPTFTAPSTTLSPSAKMNPLDVTFLLYTRNNRDQAAGDTIWLASNESSPLLNPADMSSTAAGIRLNASLPIKIVIHGFGSGGRRPWVTDMVYKLLDYEDANVIVVDWEKGATLPNYVQAAGNTRLVGHKIASLIKSINSKFGLTGNSYHLIGFSLGAHVAGFAGMEMRNSTVAARHWINRITGLDPASPLFEGYEANDRLDPSDAQFVDVIHSNGDGVLRGGFGSLQPMGHVDFYPNGGRVQVGCNSVLLSALSDIIYGKWQSLCNHRRALNFFMDSFEFNKCRFRSFNCDSYENYLKGECFDCGINNEKCSYMGYLANYSKGRGKMYLTTHEDAPFCANQFIIKIVGTKGFKTHWGKVEVTLVTLDGKNESFWLSSMSQQSGGHELGSGQKEVSQQQHCMQSLIVAHPVLVNFTQVLLRYTKYKGWIYSGDESWSIDKVFITDSDGQVKSYCGFNTILESHVTSRLDLEPGNCTVVEPAITANGVGQQISRGGQSGGNGVPNGGPTSAGGGLATNVGASSSPIPQQQLQSQSQAQAQPPQQQPPSTSQSPRTPRLFAALIQQSQNADGGQSTSVAMPSPLSHSFQRIATERSPSQFTINYSNIPFVTSF